MKNLERRARQLKRAELAPAISSDNPMLADIAEAALDEAVNREWRDSLSEAADTSNASLSEGRNSV